MKKTKKTSLAKKTLRTILLSVAATALIIILLSAALNILMFARSKGDIYDFEEIKDLDITAEYAIILGCRVNSDGSPSTMLKHRLDTGAELYFNQKAEKIIVSGNPTDEYNREGEAMKAYLVSLGIPEEDILVDNGGLSTYDTMARASEVFGVKSAFVVSQKYHLYRAMYIGEEKGIEVFGASATFGEYDNQLRYDVREYLARCKDFFMALFNLPYAQT